MTLRMQGTVEFGQDGDHRFVPHHDREDYRPLEAPTHRRPTRRVLVETVEYAHDDGSSSTREFSYPYVELCPVPSTAVQPLKPSGRYHAFPALTASESPQTFYNDERGTIFVRQDVAAAGRVTRRMLKDHPLKPNEIILTPSNFGQFRVPQLLAALIGFSRGL